jgi:lipoprotein-releasing system permease protein
MNLPIYISRRYLFSKKKANIINIITGIAAVGISIGAAALVLILCVFNGFENLVTNMMGNFNPDLKITASIGKTFVIDTAQLEKIRSVKGVEAASVSLEEIAFFQYGNTQDFGTIKGVDKAYQKATNLDKAILEGHYALEKGDVSFAIMGAGIYNKLGVNLDNIHEPLNVYMAKKDASAVSTQPFQINQLAPVGIFSIQADFDNQYIITNLAAVQGLLSEPNKASAIEVKLENPNDNSSAAEIKNILGEKFLVKDKFQQNDAFLKIMNIEKWLAFVIVCLMLVLVAFNLIGALWMIALDKKNDIAVLKAIGMGDNEVRNIFLGVGFWLTTIGIGAGFLLAILIYAIHKIFGIVPMEGLVVDQFPAQLRFTDFIIVGFTVLIIGLLASIPAAMKAKGFESSIR